MKSKKKQVSEAAAKDSAAKASAARAAAHPAEAVTAAAAASAAAAVTAVKRTVVEPVGKALGMVEKSAKERNKARAVRPARRAAKADAPKPRVRRTPAGRMLASSVAKTVEKPAATAKSPGKRTPPRRK